MTVEPGRSGENWMTCRALRDSFDLACAGCGCCCRGRRDLVLSGYDLYRIARRLGLSPRIVAGAFCKSYHRPRKRSLPALRLTPDPRTGNCRFFRGQRLRHPCGAAAGLRAVPAGAEHRPCDGENRILRADAALRGADSTVAVC